MSIKPIQYYLASKEDPWLCENHKLPNLKLLTLALAQLMGKYGIMAGKSIIGKFWDICICGDKDKKPKSFFAPLQTINVKLQIASEVVTTH